MSEWNEKRLGDLIDIKHGFAFKGDFFQIESNGNILITPGNFKIGGGWKEDKCKYYNGEIPEEYILKGGELIVTMTDLSKEVDTLGYSATVPTDPNRTFLHNQRIGLVKTIVKDVSLSFLNWLMRSPEYRFHIVASASGSTVSHTSPSRIKEFTFLLPPLPEQKAIAAVLSSLDDKIDLLHRQNKTLEALAETLFRQWFIEEAKDDWEEGTLGDLINISSGKGLKRKEYNENGSYPVLGANGIIGRTDKFLYDEKLIFTGRVGTLGNVFISESKVWLSDNTLIIKPRSENLFYFIYFYLKIVKLETFNVGSTQPLIRQSDINEIELKIPSPEILKSFSRHNLSLFNKIKHNKIQIHTLEKLRDTLLPKLISGEVRVTYENN